MSIELDHIFWMVPKSAVTGVTERFEAIGLRESYRRAHPGQGTANVCYCFENAFLEVLWLEDESEARSPSIARTLLADRGIGQANPFGMCWRGKADLAMWDFRPTYLPDGVSIPMATLSDDPCLPLLFTFPGAKPPRDLPPKRHGGMQAEAGWSSLELISMQCGAPDDLRPVADQMAKPFIVTGGEPSCTVRFSGEADAYDLKLPLG
ncbi:MAG: VOC family protein [Pseudomonadota bacterium]